MRSLLLSLLLVLVFSTSHVGWMDQQRADPELLPPVVVQVEGYPITDEDRELVERVVAAESRGEPIDGIVAVTQTIRDRAELWGMTPGQVVSAPAQYAPPYKGEIPTEVREAVSLVFDHNARAYEEPTTHFYAQALCDPYWAGDMVTRGVIGGHTFMGREEK